MSRTWDISGLLLDSIVRAELRTDGRYPNLSLFWQEAAKRSMHSGKVDEPGEVADPIRSLISGAYDYVLAHSWGKELALKRDSKNGGSFNERRFKSRLRTLERSCRKLRDGLMAEHYSLGPLLADPRMEQTINSLEWLESALPSVPIQSTMQVDFRRAALKTMADVTTAPSRGRLRRQWDLISLAVLLASGEQLNLPAEHLKQEYSRRSR